MLHVLTAAECEKTSIIAFMFDTNKQIYCCTFISRISCDIQNHSLNKK